MPNPTTKASSSSLSAKCHEDLERYLVNAPSGARQKGLRILVDDGVQAVSITSHSLVGRVLDRTLYQVMWQHHGGRWLNRCSCRLGVDCPHAMAIAHHWIQLEAGSREMKAPSGGEEEWLDRLVNVVTGSGHATPSRAAPRKSLVSRVLASRNGWDALNLIEELFEELGAPEEMAPQGTLLSFLEATEPEKRAWLLARELLKAGVPLPAELESFRNRPDFDRQEQSAREEVLSESLQSWISGLVAKPRPPERSLRVGWSWAEKAQQGCGPLATFLITGKKLRDAPRSLGGLRSFAAEALRNPGRFSASDADLLRWLDVEFRRFLTATGPYQQSHQQIEVRGKALEAWLLAWGRNDRCTWDDGTPVRLADEPVRLVADLSSDETGRTGARLGLAVDFPGGEQRPLSEVRLVLPWTVEEGRAPIFVAWKGTFHHVAQPPSVRVIEAFLAAGSLPMTPRRCAKLLPKLLRPFPHLSEKARGLVPTHAVQTSFSLALRADDHLCVRAFATSRADGRRWEFTGAGWVRCAAHKPGEGIESLGGSPSPVASAAVPDVADDGVLPDPVETGGAQLWLESLAGVEGEEIGLPDEAGWWNRLGVRTWEAFLRQWAERPTGAEYWANPAFRNFVSPSRKLFPKLKVRSSGLDWFSISAEWAGLAGELTAADMERLATTSEKYIKLSSGQWATREQMEEAKAVVEVMTDLGLDPSVEEPQKLTLWQIAGAKRESLDAFGRMFGEGADEGTAGAIRDIRRRVAEFQSLPEVPMPRRMRAEMRAYQVEGLRFLVYSSSLELGAILADDMGLGKTLQALAWMEHFRDRDGPSPCLVVCPASVVHNWRREAEKFVDGARVLLLTSGGERHALRSEIPKYDLVVTNYALLRRDLDALRQFEFRAVILDEAQNIKNPDSIVARAAKQLRARHRLTLTGTPLENRLLDLWSIADFATPGYLGTRSRFLASYEAPEKPHLRRRLAARLRPMLLRRLKREVAPDLPDRIEERRDCELTKGQSQLYVAELQRARQVVTDLAADPAFAQKKIHVLAALTRLRQVCCHPSLVGGNPGLGSGKTAALLEIVEPLIAEGHKVLVFSQFVGMLNLIEEEFRRLGIPYHMLTGQTTQRERVVSNFQDDPRACAFLLSLRAAGTGLNLTAASYVVLYDPWWNPAVEAQAIDRTHRIGQDRTVITYRLVAKNTVEDKIFQLQQQKAAVVKDVLGEEGFARSLSREDLKFLFADPVSDPSSPA